MSLLANIFSSSNFLRPHWPCTRVVSPLGRGDGGGVWPRGFWRPIRPPRGVFRSDLYGLLLRLLHYGFAPLPKLLSIRPSAAAVSFHRRYNSVALTISTVSEHIVILLDWENTDYYLKNFQCFFLNKKKIFFALSQKREVSVYWNSQFSS